MRFVGFSVTTDFLEISLIQHFASRIYVVQEQKSIIPTSLRPLIVKHRFHRQELLIRTQFCNMMESIRWARANIMK